MEGLTYAPNDLPLSAITTPGKGFHAEDGHGPTHIDHIIGCIQDASGPKPFSVFRGGQLVVGTSRNDAAFQPGNGRLIEQSAEGTGGNDFGLCFV